MDYENLKKINTGNPNFYIIDPDSLEEAKSQINEYSKTLGESFLVYSQVTVNGKDISKENNLDVYIHEKKLDHTHFEIKVPSEAFGERDEIPLTNSKKLLGTKVTIQMIQFGKTTYIFSGIITHIKNQRKAGYSYVCLKGYSPTILLDNNKRSRSFEKKTLEEIVKNVTQEAGIASDLNSPCYILYSIKNQTMNF